MSTMSLAGRPRADDGSLQVHTARLRGEQLVDLCKLPFAPSGETSSSQQQKSRQNSSPKLLHGQLSQSEPLKTQFKPIKNSDKILSKDGFKLTNWITSDEVK